MLVYQRVHILIWHSHRLWVSHNLAVSPWFHGDGASRSRSFQQWHGFFQRLDPSKELLKPINNGLLDNLDAKKTMIHGLKSRFDGRMLTDCEATSDPTIFFQVCSGTSYESMIFPCFSHAFPMFSWKTTHPTPINVRGLPLPHAVQRQHLALGEDLGRGRVASGCCTAAGRSPGIVGKLWWDYPLVMTNIAMENGPFIVSFPIKNGGSFHSYVSLPEGILDLSTTDVFRCK